MSHYFDHQPTTPSRRSVVDVGLPDVAFTLVTDRGVFSHGRLDTGTSLLIRSAPHPNRQGDLLDLGCGSGAVALTMALRAPHATVWAIDVNERARELTFENAARNGVTNIEVRSPDDVPRDVAFSTIWSNPPIRIGKPALHEMLVNWIDRLTPDGSASLVVQKHLGADSLQRWLDSHGYRTERLASRAGFRLIGVRPLSQ